MKKTKAKIVAVLCCAGVFALYILFATLMDWQHGGGTLIMILVFSLIAYIWKKILGAAGKGPTDSDGMDGGCE